MLNSYCLEVRDTSASACEIKLVAYRKRLAAGTAVPVSGMHADV